MLVIVLNSIKEGLVIVGRQAWVRQVIFPIQELVNELFPAMSAHAACASEPDPSHVEGAGVEATAAPRPLACLLEDVPVQLCQVRFRDARPAPTGVADHAIWYAIW